MNRILLSSIAFIMLAYGLCWATIINIPADYLTIQAGIDASMDGDTVLVAPGVYIEIIAVENKNILLTSEQGPENTTIQGNITFGENVDTTCVFRGFTVVGQPNNTLPLILCSYGSPTLIGNVITNCCPDELGRGIHLYMSGALITDNIIISNYTIQNGAGFWMEYSTPFIAGNLITNNRAGNYDWNGAFGGGLYIQNSDLILQGNVLANNHAIYGYDTGGGIYVYGSNLELINCTFTHNGAGALHYPWESSGGGIAISSSTVLINNSIFWENYATFDPDIWGPATVTYSDIGQGYDGEGNISSDPLFGNNFHLLFGSPCIDTGDPDSPLDPDSTRADMGAYFFDQTTDIYDPREPSGPYKFQLRQNYPNPFNSRTVISYYLDRDATVSVRIFSITGQQVATLVEGETQSAGERHYIWDGTDSEGNELATGIFFYELNIGESRQSKAMIMIK